MDSPAIVTIKSRLSMKMFLYSENNFSYKIILVRAYMANILVSLYHLPRPANLQAG